MHVCKYNCSKLIDIQVKRKPKIICVFLEPMCEALATITEPNQPALPRHLIKLHTVDCPTQHLLNIHKIKMLRLPIAKLDNPIIKRVNRELIRRKL